MRGLRHFYSSSVAEEGADVLDEQLRLLESSEVSADERAAAEGRDRTKSLEAGSVEWRDALARSAEALGEHEAPLEEQEAALREAESLIREFDMLFPTEK